MTQATEGLTTEQQQAEWNAVAQEKDGASPSDFTPPASETVTEQAPAAEAPAPEAPAETPPTVEDPFEALPEAVRNRLAKVDQLEQLLLQQNNDMKATIGRFAHMQRELDAAKKSVQAQGSTAPSQAQIAAASKNPEKWEAMKADFPDWGEAIDELLNHRLSGLQQPAPQPVDPAATAEERAQWIANEKAELRKELEEFKVEAKHGEGWKSTINTPDFVNWFAAQDATTKLLADSPRGADAIKLLDMFEKAKEKPVTEIKSDRSSRLQAAATTRPGQAPPPKTEEDMSPEELWNYMARKRQA